VTGGGNAARATAEGGAQRRVSRRRRRSAAGPGNANLQAAPAAFQHGQLARLSDASVPVAERRRLAGQLGRVKGNAHLSRLLDAASTRPAPILQRRALGKVASRPLASINLMSPDDPQAEKQVNVESELAPEGEAAKTFNGFPERLSAYALAWRHSERLCAVVEDQDGSYHALKTDFPGRGDTASMTIMPYQHGFGRLHWVNLPRVTASGEPGAALTSWTERVQRANDWRLKEGMGQVPFTFSCPHGGIHGAFSFSTQKFRRCIETEYASLLAQTLGIARAEINIIGESGDTNPGAPVGFNLKLDSKAKGGTTRLPTDRESAMPENGIVFGPAAFYQQSDIQTLGTAVHEVTHFDHAALAMEWLEKWRASTEEGDFYAWLKEQLEKRRLTKEQYDIIKEQTTEEDSTTELLSHIAGFMATFHHLDPELDPMIRFEQLNKGADFWTKAGHSAHDNTIARLKAYYAKLDPEHQADFAEHARLQAGADDLQALFWRRFVREVVG
jgi:hypothetical protein